MGGDLQGRRLPPVLLGPGTPPAVGTVSTRQLVAFSRHWARAAEASSAVLWSALSLAELTKRTVLDLFASRHEAQSCFPCCVLFGGEPAEDTAFSDGSDRGWRAHSGRAYRRSVGVRNELAHGAVPAAPRLFRACSPMAGLASSARADAADHCCICLDSLDVEDLGRQWLACGHVMHGQCVAKLRHRCAAGRCPLCRQSHADLTPVSDLLD